MNELAEAFIIEAWRMAILRYYNRRPRRWIPLGGTLILISAR